jgi:hypothetical protein
MTVLPDPLLRVTGEVVCISGSAADCLTPCTHAAHRAGVNVVFRSRGTAGAKRMDASSSAARTRGARGSGVRVQAGREQGSCARRAKTTMRSISMGIALAARGSARRAYHQLQRVDPSGLTSSAPTFAGAHRNRSTIRRPAGPRDIAYLGPLSCPSESAGEVAPEGTCSALPRGPFGRGTSSHGMWAATACASPPRRGSDGARRDPRKSRQCQR